MVECLRALREGGLTSDAHLRVFLAWPVPCKKAFIDGLDTRKQVKRSLRELVHASIPVQTYGSTQGASTEPRRKIPQPIDDSAEDVLTDPQQPLEFLLKAMDLPNNRGPFQEIVVRVILATAPGRLKFLSDTFSPGQGCGEGGRRCLHHDVPSIQRAIRSSCERREFPTNHRKRRWTYRFQTRLHRLRARVSAFSSDTKTSGPPG